MNIEHITLIATNKKSLLDKLQGALGLQKMKPLYFETRYGIHTYFMKYPIDVLVLDRNNSVVALKEDLRPFRIFFWDIAYNRVLELPKGFIKAKDINKGSQITLVLR